jgi:hypothetical protein
MVGSVTHSRFGTGGGEVASHQVGCEFRVGVAAGEALVLAGADPGQAGLAHEPLDALAADAGALALQDGVHVR